MADEEAVIADLTVNLNDGDLHTLKDLEKVSGQIRTNFERISRAAPDVASRLQDLTSPTRELSEVQGGQPSLSSQSTSSSYATPRGTSTGSLPSKREITDRLSSIQSNNPDLYENMQAERTPRVQSPETPGTEHRTSGLEALSKGTRTFSSLTQDVLGETRMGTSFSSKAAGASRLLSSVSTLGGGEAAAAGGLGAGAMGAAGIAGGVLAGGVAINAAVQKGGEQYQQYKSWGQTRGGGAKEGFGYEMQVQQMAMSPFLTSEQSRQIITSALNEGYTGKEFDTVTDFMAQNLKDMNMSVAESTKVLQTNVKEGGQSIQSLTNDLETLQSMSASGVLSNDKLREKYEQASAANIGANVSGEMASQESTIAAGMWEKDPQLAGKMSDIMTNASPLLLQQSGQMQGLRGMSPEGIQETLGNKGQLGQTEYAVLRKAAERVQADYQSEDPKKRDSAIRRFQGTMKQYGSNLDRNTAVALLDQLLGDEGNAWEDTQGEVEEKAQEQDKPKKRSFGDHLGSTLGALGDVAAGVGKSLSAMTGIGGQDWNDVGASFSAAGKQWQGLSGYSIDNLDELYDEYGWGGVKIVDDDGKQVKPTTDTEEDFYNKVSSGEYKVKVKNGEAMTLQEQTKELEQRDAVEKAGDSNTEVNVKLEMSDEMRRLLHVSTSTQTSNKARSNAGYGTATPNNPPPGDK